MSGAVWRVPDPEDLSRFRELYEGAAWTVPATGTHEDGPDKSVV